MATALMVSLLFTPGLAAAQAAFLEGHVFNKRTGVPLSGAMVRVVEDVTSGPLPVELGAGFTDANGFYQFTVEQFLGFPATIEVVCVTPTGILRGGSSALLREGPIRRDVYLGASRRLTRCQPPRAD
jgi:hypothetical protein